MALDATEIRAGLGAHVYIASAGTTMPTGLATPSNSFTELGYVSEDGVTFTSAPDFRDQMAWQSLRPIGRKRTGIEETITFGLMQINKAIVSFAFGGTTTTDLTTYYTVTPPAVDAAPDYRALVIDWKDGSDNYRLAAPKVLLTGSIELALKATEDTIIPVEVTIIEPTSGAAWTLITDDASFE